VATSAVPAVIDALFIGLTAAMPTRTVTDGPAVTKNPGDYLMIGVDDPEADTPVTSVEAQQVRATMSGARDEAGTITCCAYSWNGDSGNAGQKAARDAAFATVAAAENYLRDTDPKLGDAVLKTEIFERANVSQAQTPKGSDCLVIFSIAYLARI
jgi:hypothetical protein